MLWEFESLFAHQKQMNLKEFNNLIDLFFYQAEKQNPQEIFLHGFANTVMGEGHWNLDGHKIASQIISKEMCESLER